MTLTAADLRWELDAPPCDDAAAWRLVAVAAVALLHTLTLERDLLAASHVMTRIRTRDERRRDPLDILSR